MGYMKLYNYYVRAFLLLLSGILITSCSSDDLSRSTAKQLLLESKIEHQIHVKFYSGLVIPKDITTPGSDKLCESDYKLLDNNGVIKATLFFESPFGDIFLISIPTNIKERYVLSTKKDSDWKKLGKTYPKLKSQVTYKHEVFLADIKLGKILGITKPSENNGQRVCYVEFELLIINKSPFADVILAEHFRKSPGKYKVQFVLYDDGWRLSGKPITYQIVRTYYGTSIAISTCSLQRTFTTDSLDI